VDCDEVKVAECHEILWSPIGTLVSCEENKRRMSLYQCDLFRYVEGYVEKQQKS